jgi:alpha-ketoglutaric semialdehyde dehydrogenase
VELRGKSLIGYTEAVGGASTFSAHSPATGARLEANFATATDAELHAAINLAVSAARDLKAYSGAKRAELLRGIAGTIEARGEAIVERAHYETALTRDRLNGELARTTGQLRLFASVCEEGSWVDARIDTALPDRKPLPRPDLRSMLGPIGPVVVFGASNFPLAFSVAGGDTASALAAGNPVIVKAHPAHPGTSELVGRAIAEALERFGAPEGTFSLLFDDGVEVGRHLVSHSSVKAVGFTGSQKAGRALMDIAAARREPIPVFAEMSSSNPFFILPGALRERTEEIASGLVASITLGVGQFCTKPGLVFVENGLAGDMFVDRLVGLIKDIKPGTLLTPGIATSYRSGVDRRGGQLRLLAGEARTDNHCGASPAVFETSCETLSAELAEELFGPAAIIVRCANIHQMADFARNMPGQLTATLHGTNEDLLGAGDLVEAVQEKVGRVIFNGFPTGVEVCHAMVHGGVYPATSDARFTSVGTMAIRRFARPICFQNFPAQRLPEELRDENPRGILRLVNGAYTRDSC